MDLKKKKTVNPKPPKKVEYPFKQRENCIGVD